MASQIVKGERARATPATFLVHPRYVSVKAARELIDVDQVVGVERSVSGVNRRQSMTATQWWNCGICYR